MEAGGASAQHLAAPRSSGIMGQQSSSRSARRRPLRRSHPDRPAAGCPWLGRCHWPKAWRKDDRIVIDGSDDSRSTAAHSPVATGPRVAAPPSRLKPASTIVSANCSCSICCSISVPSAPAPPRWATDYDIVALVGIVDGHGVVRHNVGKYRRIDIRRLPRRGVMISRTISAPAASCVR